VLVVMPWSQQAAAQDAMKIAVGQRGNWNMMIADLARQKAFQDARAYARHPRHGRRRTQQAVSSNSVDAANDLRTCEMKPFA
jgi:hypothetical protein